MTVIKTASELRAAILAATQDSEIAIVRNADGSINWTESSVCDINTCSQASLTPEEREILNEFAIKNIRHVWVRLNTETCTEVLGLQVCDPTQVAPIFKMGEAYYSSSKNSTNRIPGLARAKLLQAIMETTGFCAGPTGTVDCYGMVTTLAHRAVAAFLAQSSGTIIPVYLELQIGGIPHYADIYDVARANTDSDIFFRDPQRMPEFLFVEVCEEIPDALTRSNWRTKAIKELNTLISNLHQRVNGKNVHAGGGGKLTLEQKEGILRKFASVQTTTELDKLMLKVYARSIDTNGKNRYWVGQVKQNLVALLIVLLSNRTSDGATYSVDWQLADEILTKLADSSVGEKDAPIGPFGVLLAAIARARAKAKLSKSTYSAEAVMDMVVGFAGKYPMLPDSVKNSFEGKRKATDTYLCIGGIDIGKQVTE